MKVSNYGRLPRRLCSKILLAGLILSPIAIHSGEVKASTSAVASLQGLSVGSSGEMVKALQRALISKGISVRGGVDGKFGPMTLAAVNEFQVANGLDVTTVVNEATAIAVGTVASPLTGLRRGTAGLNVKMLQEKLAEAGFRPVGGADGYFGRATEKSLKEFQESEELSPSGVADEITVARLLNSPLPDVTEKGGEGENSEKVENPPEESEEPVLSPEIAELIGVSKGTVGSAAKAVQQLLIDAGVNLRGGADGDFGRVSEAALKEYQKDHGLDQTGVADEATLLALTGSVVAVPSEYAQLVGLRPGALGDSVAALQRRLLDIGITVRGGVDGVFGPATAQALKAFQDQRGLDKTGIVDEVTAVALSKDSSEVESYGSTTGYGVYGEGGSRVLSLQTALTQAGITLRGGADGWFGSATSAAIMKFQRREGLQVTGVVNNQTAERLGLEEERAPSNSPVADIALEAFPIQGMCGYQDGWHDPRPGGRLHVGVDIIAAEGKLLYAVADGTITRIYRDFPGSMPGNGLRLTMKDGTYFFYAHLLSFADGIEVGSKVKAGQVIGRNGNTGSSGTAHLHFEIHPNGGAAINPYPIVKAIDGCSVTEPIAVTLKD
ncbi:MAG: peptidoglycan-binding protein [Actinomycetota bacterium]|nr:peptidoglycan-binding protein [Actinomycetota bacterium]